MLEIRNLTKIYRPKKGVPVTALDHLSLSLPEKGMVFILGKSGCGKSTLLNVLGGLDRADEGEIYVQSYSTEKFSQADFDSYRNTYVGFIFQEYNILEEFTVGANIGLALELQGKRATDEEIARILAEVDLLEFGHRRPNELSGGQKQRVAIARALVKSPKIIMADEPTGALDSNTGKAVFDTLKKLSAEKLVLIVSHDRDFAMQYADRIIELSDGRVISDCEYEWHVPETRENGLNFTPDRIEVSAGYQLTEQDREDINRYLAEHAEKGSVIVPEKGAAGQFTAREVPPPTGDAPRKEGVLSMIRSRLPMPVAFRIGCGALKVKKFRLVMTVLLSCVAFTLFGLADTMGSYDHVTTCVKSLIDSELNYASVTLAEKEGEGEDAYFRDYDTRLTDSHLQTLADNTGVIFRGVRYPDFFDLSIDEQMDLTGSEDAFFTFSSFSGLLEVDETFLRASGATLIAGRVPDGAKDEIVVSSFVAENFVKRGYRTDSTEKTQPVSSFEDLLGKTLSLGSMKLTVVGVADTGIDLDRYGMLLEEMKENETAADLIIRYAMLQELNFAVNDSLTGLAMVGNGFFERMDSVFPVVSQTHSANLSVFHDEEGENFLYFRYVAPDTELGKVNVLWAGEEKTALEPDEIVVDADLAQMLYGIYPTYDFYSDTEKAPATDGEYEELMPEPVDPDEVVPQSVDFDVILAAIRNNPVAEIEYFNYSDGAESAFKTLSGYRIVGIVTDSVFEDSLVIANSELVQAITKTSGQYSFAVGGMPRDESGVRRVVAFCYDNSGTEMYPLQNPVCFELDTIHSVFETLSRVFFWIGVFFAVFAAILMANFIAMSVIYKKQEIGILRALGARGNDVFRIFFSESFVIAMVNFVLSFIAVLVISFFINQSIREDAGLLITVLNVEIRQTALLLGVSLAVAALASFFPVKRMASKRPIDAIRGR